MNNTVPYGIEDISIPEYSAKVKLRAAVRRTTAAYAELNSARENERAAWAEARNHFSAAEMEEIVDSA